MGTPHETEGTSGTAALMGADLLGSVWANVTPSATRWCHGQEPRERLAFSALDLHPFLGAALCRDREWRFALGNYAYLLASIVQVARVGPTARAGSG
ncbi:MAG: hypothetical protein H0X57_06020 [Rubrobacter sp.]|nr:hypothetical protein [Rubrobacter sp.]MDQ3638841.1 hypothetical protein [Actinomycetota bacterium]